VQEGPNTILFGSWSEDSKGNKRILLQFRHNMGGIIRMIWIWNLKDDSIFAAETQLLMNQQSIFRINWNFIFSLLGMRSHYMSNLDLFWCLFLDVLIRDAILPHKNNFYWTIRKSPHNQLQLHILPIGCDITTYVKFGLIRI